VSSSRIYCVCVFFCNFCQEECTEIEQLNSGVAIYIGYGAGVPSFEVYFSYSPELTWDWAAGRCLLTGFVGRFNSLTCMVHILKSRETKHGWKSTIARGGIVRPRCLVGTLLQPRKRYYWSINSSREKTGQAARIANGSRRRWHWQISFFSRNYAQAM